MADKTQPKQKAEDKSKQDKSKVPKKEVPKEPVPTQKKAPAPADAPAGSV